MATSAIRVENLFRHVNGSTCGEMMRDCAACPASTTMTGSPGQGGASHNCVSGSSMAAGSFSSSTNNKLKSTSEPCFKTFAGKSTPAMCTLILSSTAVRWAAVTINPDFRYTPEPDCPPFRIIPTVAIHGRLLSFRSVPSEAIGAKSVTARQSAKTKRTLSSLADHDAWPKDRVGQSGQSSQIGHGLTYRLELVALFDEPFLRTCQTVKVARQAREAVLTQYARALFPAVGIPERVQLRPMLRSTIGLFLAGTVMASLGLAHADPADDFCASTRSTSCRTHHNPVLFSESSHLWP